MIFPPKLCIFRSPCDVFSFPFTSTSTVKRIKPHLQFIVSRTGRLVSGIMDELDTRTGTIVIIDDDELGEQFCFIYIVIISWLFPNRSRLHIRIRLYDRASSQTSRQPLFPVSCYPQVVNLSKMAVASLCMMPVSPIAMLPVLF